MQPGLIKGADLQELKEELGVTMVDLMWVIGRKSLCSPKGSWKLTNERSQLPIAQPQYTILIRYLLQYSEDSILPQMPNFIDLYEKVAPHFETVGLGEPTVSKAGILFGVKDCTALTWKHGQKQPSLGGQRLLYLVEQAIEQDGAAGLKRYVDIVEKEVQARGLGSISDLFQNGTWQPELFKRQLKDGAIEWDKKLITDADLYDLREILMLSWWDFIWLVGRQSLLMKWEKKQVPHTNVATCILARYLREYSEANFMPELPDYYEIMDLLEKVHSFKKLTDRVAGPLFGLTGWSLNQWRRGTKEPTPTVQHLFLILKNLIQKKGKAGFNQYLKVVEQEILARNLGGYQDVLGGWGTTAFRKKYYS